MVAPCPDAVNAASPDAVDAAPDPAPAVPAALVGLVRERRPHVVVVGDALLDGWLAGPARRLGRDGPVPVVELAESRTAAGGAANAAANLAALGASVELVSVLGDDADAGVLTGLLAAAGVGTRYCVVEPGRATAVKHRLVAAGQPVARYDAGPAGPPAQESREALGAALAAALGRSGGAAAPRRRIGAAAPQGRSGGAAVPQGRSDGAAAPSRPVDAVLVADYGGGVVTGAVHDALRALRAEVPLLVVDARAPGSWADLHPDVVTPNAAEAAALLGAVEPERERVAWAVAHRAALVAAAGGADVLVTLDAAGAVRLPADPAQPAVRTVAAPGSDARACGAGDTFTAAFTAARAAGVPAAEALALAQGAADVVVGREGTVVCTADALTARLAAADRGGLLTHRDLHAVVAEHRARGRRIVFTNGCFDVLHRGHVAYLRQARALGDLLVVALNSDESVARLKGPERPVNPLEDRAGVVGAIECVDLVTSFADDTPAALIELLRPDVYAKGGDYTPEMLPETPIVERLGGQVRVLDYLSDHSTTAIVGRIRAGRS